MQLYTMDCKRQFTVVHYNVVKNFEYDLCLKPVANGILGYMYLVLYESCHEKTCFWHMRTIKAQIGLRICAV